MKVPAERLQEIVQGNFCDIHELRAMAAELIEARKQLVESQVSDAFGGSIIEAQATLLRRWFEVGMSIMPPESKVRPQLVAKFEQLLVDTRVAVGR